MMSVECVTDDLKQLIIDDHSYCVICLLNKLKTLLIHDLNTDKTSAFMSVKVSNFSDDNDMSEMTHAVEHLSFMSTEKMSETFLLNLMMT